MSEPTLFQCGQCGSGPGDPCRTKAGKTKALCKGRGQRGAPFESPTAPVVAPRFKDPGPGLAIADVPGMPAEAATYFAMRGADTLADLRPLVEGRAAADAQCEPVADLVGLKGFELPLLVRYKASDALIKLLGGRVHMLKVMAGWPVPPAPAPADDFDEHTPPPKTRPKGAPLEAHVTLPPGEDTAGIFAQWDREGRIPAGAVLAERIGVFPFGSGTDSGYVLVAITTANPFGVRTGEEIPADQFGPWHLAVTVKRQKCPQCWGVFVSTKGGA